MCIACDGRPNEMVEVSEKEPSLLENRELQSESLSAERRDVVEVSLDIEGGCEGGRQG